jgi:hypothetical protein
VLCPFEFLLASHENESERTQTQKQALYTVTFLLLCVCVVKGRPKCSQQEVQQDGPLMSIPSVVEGLFLIRFFCREDKNQILKNVWNFILIKNKKVML